MSKNAENIIAFMGVAGANADLACRRAEPYRETLPCGSFDGVFEAVLDGRAGLGMLPIENSQAGRVSEIHQILPQAGVSIVGEYFLPVQHCLAGPKGATLEGVKEVYSHPQALMQCRQSLKQRGLSAHAFANTAMAAQQVKAWGDPTKAALCSELAVELHGLELLQAERGRQYHHFHQNCQRAAGAGRYPQRFHHSYLHSGKPAQYSRRAL
jgi:prephenate dehydratase